MRGQIVVSDKKGCKTCAFCEVIHAFDGFSFLGCKHEPYRGKPCFDIEKCPKYKREEATNEPLTLEQLKKMVGEPLWVAYAEKDEYGEQKDGWLVIEEFGVCQWREIVCFAGSDYYNCLDLYGKTWLAYAHKPETAR